MPRAVGGRVGAGGLCVGDDAAGADLPGAGAGLRAGRGTGGRQLRAAGPLPVVATAAGVGTAGRDLLPTIEEVARAVAGLPVVHAGVASGAGAAEAVADLVGVGVVATAVAVPAAGVLVRAWAPAVAIGGDVGPVEVPAPRPLARA